MKLCRFDKGRIGVVDGRAVADVTPALDVLPPLTWPLPLGDHLIANLAAVRERIADLLAEAPRLALEEIHLLSPVANPSKIIGAPINYRKHAEEAIADTAISHGRDLKSKTIADVGLFLKANSALVGPSEGVALRALDRRNDHEVELAVIIGRRGSDISRENALDHVAGYAIGLDMTVRGPEMASLRKSLDSYAVLGPWLVTAEEIENPNDLEIELRVGDELRQNSNTRNLIFDVEGLIEYASAYYTLYPGDVIMTGTPEGVAAVAPGDILCAKIERIGSMEVRVSAA